MKNIYSFSFNLKPIQEINLEMEPLLISFKKIKFLKPKHQLYYHMTYFESFKVPYIRKFHIKFSSHRPKLQIQNHRVLYHNFLLLKYFMAILDILCTFISRCIKLLACRN